MEKEKIENRAVNALRVLGAEVISHASSGHTGIVLGAAPIMYSVYREMRVDPKNPAWFNRDRFVMSAGHGSALLYATLHMFGFPITKKDLGTFRRLGSPLHGHPEVDETKGIDASTGPLGQGVALAVGLALAQKRLGAMLDAISSGNMRDIPQDMVDHHTYVLVGDGCLMEGISYEACNLAGLWKLNQLIMLYDSNQITLDGSRSMADGEDVEQRFRACGWDVLRVADGNDVGAISAAIRQAKKSQEKPTLVVVETKIGYGASAQGSHKAHGQVLSAAEIAELRKKWGLLGEKFCFDAEIDAHFAGLVGAKAGVSSGWLPPAGSFLSEFVDKSKKKFEILPAGKKMSIRDAGHEALQAVFAQTPRVWGGSADVASTTKAFVSKNTISSGGMSDVMQDGFFSVEKTLAADIAFGVREFAMAGICNGLALHGFMPYCSTFLAFSDYARSAIRLGAMMNLPVHYIFSHDGIGNPPDGPTHQATEHTAALRIIPNLTVFRPADDVEAFAAYKWVYENATPAATLLSRGGESDEFQKINAQFKITDRMEAAARGGYVIAQTIAVPKVVLIATGTEVSLALEVQRLLGDRGVGSSVVSMPSTHLFDAQSTQYKREVLGGGSTPIVAIEMGNGDAWYKYTGTDGLVISFDRFGSSGTESEMREELGFTKEKVAKKVFEFLRK